MGVEEPGKPLVSVVMATYNEPEAFIGASIRSILAQTCAKLELLILDDSTREETIRVIDEAGKDPRVRIIRGKQRKGFVRSLNEGLEASKGMFIARMDGDDVSLPDRLEKQVEYLQGHPEVMALGGQLDIINEKGEVTSHRKYPLKGASLYFFSCFRSPLAHPSVMMRRDVVDAGMRYDEALPMSEDLDLWLRMMNRSMKIENLPDTLLQYRVVQDFEAKRVDHPQFDYSYTVRKNNFSGRHFFHSALSCAGGWVVKHAPRRALKSMYHWENTRREEHSS